MTAWVVFGAIVGAALAGMFAAIVGRHIDRKAERRNRELSLGAARYRRRP